MHIVDSCGWLEWFSDGSLADAYAPHLRDEEQLLVPAVVLFEVYKILKRETDEEKAILAASSMKRSLIVPLEEVLSLKVADTALQNNLAMADAIVYATALLYEVQLYTSDADFQGLPLVQMISE
ncbi:MAG: type II toxin-antitoxin system VapC family toxin [Desulfohalobiaceae bacterium]|nr:type II toxin-antitoxin system VapC family toxin [Desulfohalobiaceae bacterium]